MKHRVDAPRVEGDDLRAGSAGSADVVLSVRPKQKRVVPPDRWEIFDETRLRKVRWRYFLSFAAGMLLTLIATYFVGIVPLNDRIVRLEERRIELAPLVTQFEEQSGRLASLLEELESHLHPTLPSVATELIPQQKRVAAETGWRMAPLPADTGSDAGY